MTSTNSGSARRYDGQPMPTKPSAQHGECLDDIILKELVDRSGLSADEIKYGNPEMVGEKLGICNSYGTGYWNGHEYIQFVTKEEYDALMAEFKKKSTAIVPAPNYAIQKK